MFNMKNIENHPYILLHRAITEKIKASPVGKIVMVDVLILGKMEIDLIRELASNKETYYALQGYLISNGLNKASGARGVQICPVDAESEFIVTFTGDENLVDVWKSVKEKYPNAPLIDEKIKSLTDENL